MSSSDNPLRSRVFGLQEGQTPDARSKEQRRTDDATLALEDMKRVGDELFALDDPVEFKQPYEEAVSLIKAFTDKYPTNWGEITLTTEEIANMYQGKKYSFVESLSEEKNLGMIISHIARTISSQIKTRMELEKIRQKRARQK